MTRLLLRFGCVLAICSGLGCGESGASTTDAGGTDAGSDAAMNDATMNDAAMSDAAMSDAAMSDAAMSDAADADPPDAANEVTGITIDQDTVLIDDGGRATLVITASLMGGGTQTVSSGVSVTAGDVSIASLDGLDIVGESAGTTTLTLSYEGFTDTVTVGVRATYRIITEPSTFFERAGFGMGTASSNNSVTFGINAGSAYEGTESLKMNFAGTQAWGGVYLFSTGSVDATSFAGGHVIVNVLDASMIGDMYVKLEWTGSPDYPGVLLSGYTPTVTQAGWSTYAIPLADFPSIALGAITVLGFWHPCRPGDCGPVITQAYSGTVTIDGVFLRGPSPLP